MTGDTPPIGKLARTAVAGATAARIGAKKLGLLSKRPFLSDTAFQQQRAENDQEIAEALFQGLGRLRGTALKLAQTLSLEFELLPEVYRRELYKSHYRAPPLNRAVVRRLITSEFGVPPETLFATFDPTAFAAASLGQVHRATTWEGEHVAVKVQYPGIGTALTNDFRLVKQFLLPRVRTAYVVNITREIERRLSEEVDYDRERRNTQWFHEHGQRPGVVIPRTFEAYSSATVLTMQLVDGEHLDDWLMRGPTQEQRDQVAQHIYDFFMHSLFGLHTMHCDPNPGNYLFRNDDSVAVIDFGSVKHFEPALCGTLLDLWRAHLRNDPDGIVAAYCALGLAQGDKQRVAHFCTTTLRPLGEWMSRPYREHVFDFGKHRDFCAQGAQLLRDLLARQEMDGFTAETVMFDRNIYGLFRIFTELQARVRMANQWVS